MDVHNNMTDMFACATTYGNNMQPCVVVFTRVCAECAFNPELTLARAPRVNYHSHDRAILATAHMPTLTDDAASIYHRWPSGCLTSACRHDSAGEQYRLSVHDYCATANTLFSYCAHTCTSAVEKRHGEQVHVTRRLHRYAFHGPTTITFVTVEFRT